MDKREFCDIAGQLMRHPAAPFHEGLVQGAVEGFCAANGLPVSRDRAGNLYVRSMPARRGRPLFLVAHLDHPGFVVRWRKGEWLAEFLGGVADSFFQPGLPIRVLPGGERATLGPRRGRRRVFALRTTHDLRTPKFAVWALGDFLVKGDRIIGRACDDLIGAATVLAVARELRRLGSTVNFTGLLTRAEEVGFLGALWAVGNRRVPRGALVVSLETSKEIPPVKMGQGPIIRVGDRASIFDSAAARFLVEVATRTKTSSGEGKGGGMGAGLRFQRALMSGGTCEATVFHEAGYQTAATCVALGNYHNCTPHGRIGREYVDANDCVGQVRLLVNAAQQLGNFERIVGALPRRLEKLAKEADALKKPQNPITKHQRNPKETPSRPITKHQGSTKR